MPSPEKRGGLKETALKLGGWLVVIALGLLGLKYLGSKITAVS